MAFAPNDLLEDLLRQTSRSFYLTLRALPRSIRPQIGLAYLLARTSDTIADTDLVSLEQRLRCLENLRERILGTGGAQLEFGDLARRQGSAAERLLLERCESSLARLQALPDADRQLIREVLKTIMSGQESDLRRFAGAAAHRLVALQTDAELDDYTYRVAGCVGEFWTRMCRAHVFPGARLDEAFLLENGVRFGKGLQLVNILRDLPLDLRQGRCYLPAEHLAAVGLAPDDLLQPDRLSKFQSLYEALLDRAEAHLAAGWAYTLALPWRNARVRLACAWPILIALQTIERLRTANVLDPRQRIKISRVDVRRIILQSVLRYPIPPLWRQLARFPRASP
jgi:farnesyl-diphosphate farnesyltransferase